MRQLLLLTFALAVLLSAPPLAQACIWDDDTLAMERAKFPEASELIAGSFVRHSPPYYQWRIDRLTDLPRSEMSPRDFDNLAVAYDKLGKKQKAIDTMLDKIERHPDQSVYESQANLGTFYIHAGQYEKGLTHIGNAIKINPEAHFGREVYQKLVVEYVIEVRKIDERLPLSVTISADESSSDEVSKRKYNSFRSYVFDQQVPGDDDLKYDEKIERAVKGVLGMMRFGHHDSPILLEALGDLIDEYDREDGAQRLAARAYLKASYEVEDALSSEAYRKMARRSLGGQLGETIESIETQLKREIAQGDAFFEELQADEQRWIDQGKDVDVEFQKAYYDPGTTKPLYRSSTSQTLVDPITGYRIDRNKTVLLLVGLALLATAAFVGVTLFRRGQGQQA